MRSEAVPEELLRNTPMRQFLVREAWPDLSTESRLQVIQAMIVEPLAGISEWLSARARRCRAHRPLLGREPDLFQTPPAGGFSRFPCAALRSHAVAG